MSKSFITYVCFIYCFLNTTVVISQRLPSGIPLMEEAVRRHQLIKKDSELNYSFHLRPISQSAWQDIFYPKLADSVPTTLSKTFLKKITDISILPFLNQVKYQAPFPYPESGYMLNSNGAQFHSQFGAFFRLGPLHLQVQPSFRWIENRVFEPGRIKSLSTEYLENYGEGPYSTMSWGQSSVSLQLGAFSLGLSNENIWWGPGQWNSLTFSNNAFGFPHISLRTNKPAKTFLGNFEGQLLMGRLEDSGFSELYPEPYRYLNALMVVYQPRWIPGLSFGVSRTFQQYDSFRENTFESLLPVLSAIQKVAYGFDEDLAGLGNRDQQLTMFTRFVIPSAKAEIYAEFGRRDHALNWREAILNPEHARAYLLGFVKLFEVSKGHIQVRGEMLQQQESINTLVRYLRNSGGNWGGHADLRQGFTHRGQMMATGIGPGSNIQVIETSWVKSMDKYGVRLERLNRHQDLYVSVFNDPSPEGRWVDFSLILLYDKQWNRFLLQSQGRLTSSMNREWALVPDSSLDFPQGTHALSFGLNVSLLYFLSSF